ncbi:MAG TPA: prolipoprotein diacylglyceryl transferase family protein [Planctomycetaceae bacterium]
MPIDLPDVYLSYAIPVLVALLLGVLFPVTRHIRQAPLRRQYYLLQLVTFLSAIVGAKLAFLFGEFGWPLESDIDWRSVLVSGRSIVGALIFGLLGAEIAKPLLHYPLPPNDRFAALLPFTIGIGRIGCLLSGCCGGVSTRCPLAIVGSDGVARHPTQLYEMAFHFSAGIAAVVLIRQQRFQGCIFSLYLIAYGFFRLLTEFIRETSHSFGWLSSYQWLSLVMISLGTGFLVKRRTFPSAAWK